MKTYRLFNIISILIFLSFTLLLFFSCNSTEPEIKEKEKSSIEAIDVSCDEIWLKLKVGEIDLPAAGVIRIDGTKEKLFSVTIKDTILYIDSLEVNRYYKFQVILANNGDTLTGNEATVKTLDTTSHNFSYETHEFGDYSSSSLLDVAIIDENNIWAVGEIYMKDSLGNNDPKRYNAVHWDGVKWEAERIYYYGACSAVNYPPLKAILTFSDTNIVVTNGGSIGWYNGKEITLDCGVNLLLTGAVNRIWGTSINDIYIVGDAGNIAHYDGNNWTKIESGTNFHLTDISANINGRVFISGINMQESKGVLLRGNRSEGFAVMVNSGIINQSELFNPKLYGELQTVWVDDNGTVYTGGNILFWNKNNKWDYVKTMPENYIGGNQGASYRGFIYAINGNGSNDYIVAGDRNTLKHFNGKTWTQLGLPYSLTTGIMWWSVEQKGNIAVAVGVKGSKAFIIKLKR